MAIQEHKLANAGMRTAKCRQVWIVGATHDAVVETSHVIAGLVAEKERGVANDAVFFFRCHALGNGRDVPLSNANRVRQPVGHLRDLNLRKRMNRSSHHSKDFARKRSTRQDVWGWEIRIIAITTKSSTSVKALSLEWTFRRIDSPHIGKNSYFCTHLNR